MKKWINRVSVESELGTIGTTGNSIEGGTTGVIYTDPDQAKDFVEKTGTRRYVRDCSR